MTTTGERVGRESRASVLPTYARADVTIVRGDGCRVWDDAGKEYLDFGGGIAVVVLGHRHPAVTAAAHAQLDELWHASNLYWTEPMLRLAALLAERMGDGVQAFFCNSGAEANEAALKVARSTLRSCSSPSRSPSVLTSARRALTCAGQRSRSSSRW